MLQANELLRVVVGVFGVVVFVLLIPSYPRHFLAKDALAGILRSLLPFLRSAFFFTGQVHV